MKIKCSEINNLPIVRALKVKYGADFLYARGFDPDAHEVEVWHILRYLNHNIHRTITTDYVPLDVFDCVAEMPDAEMERIQNLMIEKINEL